MHNSIGMDFQDPKVKFIVLGNIGLKTHKLLNVLQFQNL